jgi:PilZ domain-containing protein
MDADRRQSMRVSTRLPCEWQLVDGLLNGARLHDVFALPGGAGVAAALTELGAAINNALENIQDLHVRHAISMVNQKVDLLAPPHSSPEPIPAQSVVLSHDGMQLTAAQALEVDQFVAVHIVLDDGLSFLECGSVTRCCQVGRGYEIGITFNAMSASNSKRLARQVMRTRA